VLLELLLLTELVFLVELLLVLTLVPVLLLVLIVLGLIVLIFCFELFRILVLLSSLDLVALELVDSFVSLGLTSGVLVVVRALVFTVSLFTVVRVDVSLSLTTVLGEVVLVSCLTVVFVLLLRTGIFLLVLSSFLTSVPESPLLTVGRVTGPRLSQSRFLLGMGSL
jgi:hypothetical protein